MPKVGRVGRGKFVVRQEPRRSEKEISFAILLRQEFWGDFRGRAEAKYSSRSHVPIGPICWENWWQLRGQNLQRRAGERAQYPRACTYVPSTCSLHRPIARGGGDRNDGKLNQQGTSVRS
jgi:hypothetical protein